MVDSVSTAGGRSSIPGWRTKIPHAVWCVKIERISERKKPVKSALVVLGKKYGL